VVASVVVDSNTHEVLIGCRDMTASIPEWPSSALYPCGTGFSFLGLGNLYPERTGTVRAQPARRGLS
jgi:hypothetical protein